MNIPVSFPIAKLLKEKGFDLPAQKYYEHALKSVKNREDGYSGPFGWKKGELNLQTGYFVNNSKTADVTSEMWYMCSAPTIADVVMWFYEKHKIWINVVCHPYGELWYSSLTTASKSLWGDEDKRHEILNAFRNFPNEHDTPTKAYEAAFEHTLNNLI